MLYQRKICPCCRSQVRNRPVPLFLLNAVLSAFTPGTRSSDCGMSSHDDPWADIFFEEVRYDGTSNSDGASDDLSDLSEDENEIPSDHHDLRTVERGLRLVPSGTPSDDELSELSSLDDDSSVEDDNDVMSDMEAPAYSAPLYRAPTIRRRFPGATREQIELLQRGAPLPMIERYRMRYDEEEGIVAWADTNTEVYIGWNILLTDFDPLDGRRFMTRLMNDLTENPRNWRQTNLDTHVVYRRRVPSYCQETGLGFGSDTDSDLDSIGPEASSG